MLLLRILGVYASCGVYVSGVGAENIGMANTQRKKEPSDKIEWLMREQKYQETKKGKGNCRAPVF
jgi:hypothetical protein